MQKKKFLDSWPGSGFGGMLSKAWTAEQNLAREILSNKGVRVHLWDRREHAEQETI